MRDIQQQLSFIHQKISASVERYQRRPEDVQLLAVSKTQPAEKVAQAYDAGQRAFGENYLQEARDKQQALAELAIEWHFIGPIQSNKTREIAEHFSWVHSVDRLKIAKRLSQQRPEHMPDLNICLQVNIDNEPTKSGISVSELKELVSAIGELPKLKLRGLMVIPAKRDSVEEQRAVFAQVHAQLRELSQQHPALPLDTLSMGMSDDMEAAIAEGANIVRIGSALFGPRNT